MKPLSTLFTLAITLLITACSPHPASGVWKSLEDNDYGIEILTVSFDGRANFTTPKLDNAEWHCFWSATGNKETELNCNPSTDPDKKEIFLLTINNQGLAELRHNTQLIASFTLQDKNPSSEN